MNMGKMKKLMRTRARADFEYNRNTNGYEGSDVNEGNEIGDEDEENGDSDEDEKHVDTGKDYINGGDDCDGVRTMIMNANTPVTRHSVNAVTPRDCQKRGRGGVTAFTDQYYSRRRAVVLPSRNFPIHRGVTEASPTN